VLLNFFKTR